MAGVLGPLQAIAGELSTTLNPTATVSARPPVLIVLLSACCIVVIPFLSSASKSFTRQRNARPTSHRMPHGSAISPGALPAAALKLAINSQCGKSPLNWVIEAGFSMRSAATIIRNTLVDNARARKSSKRGGPLPFVVLGPRPCRDFVAAPRPKRCQSPWSIIDRDVNWSSGKNRAARSSRSVPGDVAKDSVSPIQCPAQFTT
jgi:hypothetical protein